MKTVTFNFADAATDSTETHNLSGFRIAGILFPAGMEGVICKFKSHPENATPIAVHDSAGVEISLTVAASRYVVPTLGFADALRGLGWTKMVLGAQTGAAAVKVLLIEDRGR